jgi:hypothetical protein
LIRQPVVCDAPEPPFLLDLSRTLNGTCRAQTTNHESTTIKAMGLCAGASFLSVLPPRLAGAQSATCPNISLNVNLTVPLYFPGGDTAANLYPYRPQNLDLTAIDYKDCIDDIHLEFTVLIGGLPCTDEIWVWAGTTDCTQTTARERNSGSGQCWPVAPIGAFSMAETSTANIRAQDIVAHISDSSSASTTYSPAGKTACQWQSSPGIVPLSIYFMAVEADGVTVDRSASYALDAELVATDGGSGTTAPADAGPVDASADAGTSDPSATGTPLEEGSIGCMMVVPGQGMQPPADAARR